MIAILGAPDMGKSTLLKYLIAQYMKANPGIPVIGADPGGGFREAGLPGEWPRFGMDRRAMGEWVAELTNHGKGPPGPRVGLEGALVYFDDFDRYAPSAFPGNGSEYDPWRDIALAYRHLRLDVMFNFHRPADVDKGLLNSATDVVPFALPEVGARRYLGKLEPATIGAIPTTEGKCLWICRSPRSVQVVDVFKLCPLPGKKAKNG